MKLTPENIAAIEDLLTKREAGMSFAAIAEGVGGDKAQLSCFFSILRRVGVPLTELRGNLANAAEIAQFRAWKAAKSREQSPAQQ